jgi:hypothetical protein
MSVLILNCFRSPNSNYLNNNNNNNKMFNIADSVLYTINSTRGIAATLCTLETWFVSGI